MGRYKVWIEEDNDFSSPIFWIIVIVLGLLCFIYVGIPLLICYLLYKLIKYFVNRNKKNKEVAHLRCPSCGKKEALRHFKDEIVYSRPKKILVHSKKSTYDDNLTVTEVCTRHFEKCIYCGEILFTDSIEER